MITKYKNNYYQEDIEASSDSQGALFKWADHLLNKHQPTPQPQYKSTKEIRAKFALSMRAWSQFIKIHIYLIKMQDANNHQTISPNLPQPRKKILVRSSGILLPWSSSHPDSEAVPGYPHTNQHQDHQPLPLLFNAPNILQNWCSDSTSEESKSNCRHTQEPLPYFQLTFPIQGPWQSGSKTTSLTRISMIFMR